MVCGGSDQHEQTKRPQQSVVGILDREGACALTKANQGFMRGLLLGCELRGVDRWEAGGGHCC